MTSANNQLQHSGSESCNAMGVGDGRRERIALEQEALANAIRGQSLMNFGAIFEGFMEKGVLADDIKPRENVFTFNAWKALGRSVKKGEHGVRVCTFVPTSKIDKETGEVSGSRMPRQTTVFHVSQTEEIQSKAAA